MSEEWPGPFGIRLCLPVFENPPCWVCGVIHVIPAHLLLLPLPNILKDLWTLLGPPGPHPLHCSDSSPWTLIAAKVMRRCQAHSLLSCPRRALLTEPATSTDAPALTVALHLLHTLPQEHPLQTFTWEDRGLRSYRREAKRS